MVRRATVFLSVGLAAAAWCAVAAAQPKPYPVAEGITLQVPAGWEPVEPAPRNALELVRRADDKSRNEAHVIVVATPRRSHAEALDQLAETAVEGEAAPSFRAVGGWPGLTLRRLEPLARTGEEHERVDKAYDPQERAVLRVTAAAAVGATFVRLEATLGPEGRASVAKEILALVDGFAFAAQADAGQTERELGELPRRLRQPEPGQPRAPRPAPSAGTPEKETGVPVLVQTGVGELEVAASNDGQTVVVAANSGFSRSTDGGATFAFVGATPAPFPRDGDPSLGVGQSGAFYYAFIGFPNGTPAALGVNGCTTGVSRSTDGGQTFPFRGHAFVCPFSPPGLCFPDQEHIAADRFNAAPGGDQVYSVWRHFVPAGAPANCQSIGSGFPTASIVCSSDGGSTWSARTVVDAAGDFPRVSTGSDGFVYVTYRSGGNVRLNKFSSCTAGLVQQAGFPVTVSAFTDVACPVAGLDRCNNGNILASPMVAVDDLEPSHVYVAYATNTAAGNDDVRLRDSTDGGLTWPAARVVTLNTAVAARRFMPWVCALGGVAHASWYDRRAATVAANDLTGFFRGSAAVKGGTLTAGTEFNVAGVNDPQCASGWPCGTRSSGDSESCSVQPQNAGACRNAMGGGSGTACDFSAPVCPAGETCQTGSGCPKYGDYNGNACIAGRVYSAWSSATPPAGVPAGAGIRVFADASAAPSDFFVRDWTVNATNHDTGPEPSTNPVFYTTSDVWSQITSTPAAPVSDWVVGDPAQKGAGAAGDNFAFVRVSRRTAAAPGVPNVDVTAHFLTADYGLGTNFVAAGAAPDPTLTFTAADLTKTLNPGYSYHVAATASTHYCLAVEISAPGDPFIAPSLLGGAPGPSDPRILEDNNKAQRNLGTVVGTGAAGAAFYAIVHNAELVTRNMTVEYRLDPKAPGRLQGGRVGVVGGRRLDLGPSGKLVLEKMQPGENRWVELELGAFEGRDGDLIPVHFSELHEERAVNGFTVAALVAPIEKVALANLRAHRDLFVRLGALKLFADGEKEAYAAQVLLDYGPRLSERDYSAFVGARLKVFQQIVPSLLKRAGGRDLFGLAAGLKQLEERAGRPGQRAAAHIALLNKIDAHLTHAQKAQGDAADVLQNTRWQRTLFARWLNLAGAREIVAGSDEFARAFTSRKVGPEGFAQLLDRQAGLLARFAKDLGDEELAAQAEAVKRALKGPLAALQKAHRDYLLRLQAIAVGA